MSDRSRAQRPAQHTMTHGMANCYKERPSRHSHQHRHCIRSTPPILTVCPQSRTAEREWHTDCLGDCTLHQNTPCAKPLVHTGAPDFAKTYQGVCLPVGCCKATRVRWPSVIDSHRTHVHKRMTQTQQMCLTGATQHLLRAHTLYMTRHVTYEEQLRIGTHNNHHQTVAPSSAAAASLSRRTAPCCCTQG